MIHMFLFLGDFTRNQYDFNTDFFKSYMLYITTVIKINYEKILNLSSHILFFWHFLTNEGIASL